MSPQIILYCLFYIFLIIKTKPYIKLLTKNITYSLFFIIFLMGFWEIPLFIFGAEQGLLWALTLFIYILPFYIICSFLKIHFTFGKKEYAMLGIWCIIASILAIINILINTYNPLLWNYGVSYLDRSITLHLPLLHPQERDNI